MWGGVEVMEGIKIGIEKVGANKEVALVTIQGYVDTTTASELERIIQNLLSDECYKILIDLKEVDYISSAGWGIFISEIKNIRGNKGDLVLANMSESVSEVYELLEFSTILTATNSVEAGLDKFLPVAERETKNEEEKPEENNNKEVETSEPISENQTEPEAQASSQEASEVSEEISEDKSLSLLESIRRVIKEHPDWGAWKIKAEINKQRDNKEKVKWLEVRRELKHSNLNTKEARFRYARGN